MLIGGVSASPSLIAAHEHSVKLLTTDSKVRFTSVTSRISPLAETLCIVFVPCLLVANGKNRPQYGRILAHILSKGYQLVGGYVTPLASRVVDQYCLLGARSERVAEALKSGSALVMALERNNAISCARDYLCGREDRDSLDMEWGSLVLASIGIKQAASELELLFTAVSR